MNKLEEIRDHLDGVLLDLEQVPKDIPSMSYPELKMQLMVNYVANLAYYLTLRMQGTLVADHPVFKHLAYLRTFMERLVPLDASLKYQIDKLLLQDDEEVVASAPNLSAFVPNAVKAISIEQLNTGGELGNFEIDPALIAAEILKAQQGAKRKHEEPNEKKKKAKVESSDEDIDSDFDL